ncbi:hypothetical protein [Neorhizobium galegae]|uniref:hypothetical protein n=1 Tax=Neorhizobium galegae TaxID=399 RepID=UPI001272B37D|nr:hypothetical protein [Neorhizobium galegae]KAA9385702.1 hypothetical protein F4V88_04110 [Neorhizobium galegae]MCM2499654.1 hypothetical protein [Neorhizobium galegae]
MKEFFSNRFVKIVVFFLVCAVPGGAFQIVDPVRLGGYTAFSVSFAVFVTALSLWPMLSKDQIRALFYGSVLLALGFLVAFLLVKLDPTNRNQAVFWLMIGFFGVGVALIGSYAYANRKGDRLMLGKEIVATVATAAGALLGITLGAASAVGF